MDKRAIDILEQKNKLLTEIYFELQEYFEEKYGKDTLIFMEVGSFFELYEVNNEELKIGKAKEIAEYLNIQLTRKNKSILQNSVKNPLMAGFPSISLERYLSKLLHSGKYTIVLIRQRGIPPKISRYIDRVISPGTDFDYRDISEEKNIVSIVVDYHKGIWSIGYSAIDITTGKTYINEIHSKKDDKNYALDELFYLLQAHLAGEVVITLENKEIDKNWLINYLELNAIPHTFNTKKAKISYQNAIFEKVFDIHSFLTPIEYMDLEHYPLCSMALTILIEFIVEHDENLIQKMNKPIFLGDKRSLYLGNNALEQLGVLSKERSEISLLKLIDKSSTAFGKRLLRERLLNPICDKDILNARYDLSQKLIPYIEKVSPFLKEIYDLERLSRRIKLQRLHPMELNYIADSLRAVDEVLKICEEAEIERRIGKDIKTSSQSLLSLIEKEFDLDNCEKVKLEQIKENLFKRGVYPEIDSLIDESNKEYEKLKRVAKYIESLFEEDKNFVQISYMESEGFYLSLTRNRFKIIEERLKESFINIEGNRYFFEDFNFKMLKSSVKIYSPLFEEISKEIESAQIKITALVKERYLNSIEEIDKNYSSLFEELVAFLGELDVALSNAKCAVTMKLSRPILEDGNFYEAISLRHPIIEANEERGIYIPHNVYLGESSYSSHEHIMLEASQNKDINGVLLYGINSSGKSSLMKSVGLSVILAQAGFFVPVDSLRMGIFTKLFTRIVSRDNLYKGLSTFAVEMMELKNIFNRADENSLILGDEISQGTETLSALAIVSSTILKLSRLKSKFIFATHLHNLADIDEIKSLESLIFLHLGVSYDEKSDRLIYNRKLEIGMGDSLYGLEFAKSLHMDKEFLRIAYDIRDKLSKKESEIKRLKSSKANRYNKDLWSSRCALCDEEVEEIHHISPQSMAADSGHIGYFHKNHRYNLIPLCKKHHNMVHRGEIRINGFVMTDEGLQLHYEENIKD